MDASERDTLVRAYVQYATTRSPEWEWAWQDVFTAMGRLRPEESWDLVKELVRATPEGRPLASVAAGPLESFLAEHGTRFIDDLVVAGRDPHFRAALAGVWTHGGDISGRLWDTIQRILDGEQLDREGGG